MHFLAFMIVDRKEIPSQVELKYIWKLARQIFYLIDVISLHAERFLFVI